MKAKLVDMSQYTYAMSLYFNLLYVLCMLGTRIGSITSVLLIKELELANETYGKIVNLSFLPVQMEVLHIQ